MTTFEIVRSDGKQQWHAREVAGNNEKCWTTETYSSKQGAVRAVCRLAERFGWRDVEVTWDGPMGDVEDALRGIHIADVRLVDERDR